MKWFFYALKQGAVFRGRSGRAEYWYFFLFSILIGAFLGGIDKSLETHGLLASMYSLAVLIPATAVGVRRLHDTNRSGWWLTIGLIPIIGVITLLILMSQPGSFGDNRFGPSPR